MAGIDSSSDRPRFTGVIALDGPSGTGKSTVARLLAIRLGSRYLDTGSMYRAATLAVLNSDVPLTDAQAIGALVAAQHIAVGTDPHDSWTSLNGIRVDEEIRHPATTAAVSAVSAVPEVRRQLVAAQRRLIAAGATVAEGRDIGSVVWPAAEVKVYLTASESERARRRAAELDADLSQTAVTLRRRDSLDSMRAVSPLRKADGALELDTSSLSIEQVVDALAELAAQRSQLTTANAPSGG